jgi:hypothetical protein
MYQKLKLKEIKAKSGSAEPELRMKANIPLSPPFDES